MQALAPSTLGPEYTTPTASGERVNSSLLVLFSGGPVDTRIKVETKHSRAPAQTSASSEATTQGL